MNEPMIAYIALGSNLGDRNAALAAAKRGLEEQDGVTVLRMSTMHETEPVGPPGQGAYLNAAIMIETIRSPRELLEICLAIESRHGRRRADEQRWGPRRLDLDILLFGDKVIDEPGLTIPHQRMHERRFVLGPLVEIAPDIIHPTLAESIQTVYRRVLKDSDRHSTGIR